MIKTRSRDFQLNVEINRSAKGSVYTDVLLRKFNIGRRLDGGESTILKDVIEDNLGNKKIAIKFIQSFRFLFVCILLYFQEMFFHLKITD